MATLEEQFNRRVNEFLDDTGIAPTTLGMLAVGDPSLLRQIERGRSPTLRTADRVLAFIDHYELVTGSAKARPVAKRTQRSEAMSERPRDKKTKPPIRFLRISEVQARTGLGRSTIYRWSADGRFPRPIRLSARAMRWIEAEVDEWTRRRITASGGGRRVVAY